MNMKMRNLLFVVLLTGAVSVLYAQDDDITNAFDDLNRKGEMKTKEEAMAVPATEEEVASFCKNTPDCGYFCFPENRSYAIRHWSFLPKRWMSFTEKELSCFQGEAQPGEFYTYQLGLYAAGKELKEVKLKFSDLKSDAGTPAVSAKEIRCFNTGGTDIYGKDFIKTVDVPKGALQALWIGLPVPQDARGTYRGQVTVRPANAAPSVIDIVLEVKGDAVADSGDNEGWRHSRLRWLDSRAGAGDEPTQPYIPLTVEGNTIGYLGGEVSIGANGLPEKIITHYTQGIVLNPGAKQEVLAGGMELEIETPQGVETLKSGKTKIERLSSGKVRWENRSSGKNLTVACSGLFDFDGFSDVRIDVTAKKRVQIEDIRLNIPYSAYASEYFMGLGEKGGFRKFEQMDWKWDTLKRQDEFWMGNVNSGLHIKFKDDNYRRPLVNVYYALGRIRLPESWGNENKGGIRFASRPDGGQTVTAYSGKRTLAAGETQAYCFDMLITPVKPIDMATHTEERFYHSNSDLSAKYIESAKQNGANIINIHHKKDIYPFINYPYSDESVADLKRFVEEAHRQQIKVKTYYTTRELTVKIPEIWALRSLGGEVIFDGPGKDTRTLIHQNGPNPWLNEHFKDHFIPAWYNAFNEGKYKGDMDISVITTPDSRWNNYYLAGLKWMVDHLKIDGIYIDDSALDRKTLQRGRRILDADGNRRNVDMHSWNHMNQWAGYANSLLIYNDLFPYVDRLWIGEGFSPASSPDFWLVEMSGIPFGLLSETLNSHNYWRGMIYCMTPRLPWSGDPTPLWGIFDRFGIRDAAMHGYWDAACAVKTDNPNVYATVYQKADSAFVVLANWTDREQSCRLVIDREKLGFVPGKITAPALKNIQEEKSGLNLDSRLDMEGNRGLFLLLEK